MEYRRHVKTAALAIGLAAACGGTLAQGRQIDCAWRAEQGLAVVDPDALGWRGAPAYPGSLSAEKIRQAASTQSEAAQSARPLVAGLPGCAPGNRELADAIDQARAPATPPPRGAGWFERMRHGGAQKTARARNVDDALALRLGALRQPRAMLMLDAEVESAGPNRIRIRVLRPMARQFSGRLALCGGFLAASSSTTPERVGHCLLLRNLAATPDNAFIVDVPAKSSRAWTDLPPTQRRLWLRTTPVSLPERFGAAAGTEAADVKTMEIADVVEFLATGPGETDLSETVLFAAVWRPGRDGPSPIAKAMERGAGGAQLPPMRPAPEMVLAPPPSTADRSPGPLLVDFGAK